MVSSSSFPWLPTIAVFFFNRCPFILAASSMPPSKAPSLQPNMIMRTLIPTTTPTNAYFWWNSTIDKSILTSKDKNLGTMSMVYTLLINLVLFVFFLIFFEYNRHYKQIFLKRYQKRFIDIGQVPPQPSDRILGWLFATWSLPEIDVLHMVGLDAYMLLRYQVICIKVGLFLTFFGLVFLIPIYATADGNLTEWDKFTILNSVNGSDGSKMRIWATILFAYIFSAYFCQVFYSEYDRFSTLRLSYLTKVDEVNPSRLDPDVMPQKEYTIMIEQIPSELRSEHKLFEHFDDLFPGEVFTVEVALDLRQLNKLVGKRKSIRGNLEMAIAHYLATHQRLIVNGYTRKMKISDILAFEEDSNRPIYIEQRKDFHSQLDSNQLKKFHRWSPIINFVRIIQRDVFGYESVDAVNYYTAMLIDYNNQVRALQGDLMDISKNIDVELQKRIKNKYDTRMAVALGMLGAGGNSLLEMVEEGLMEPQYTSIGDQKSKKERRGSIKGKQRRRSIGSARDITVPSAHPSTTHTRHPLRSTGASDTVSQHSQQDIHTDEIDKHVNNDVDNNIHVPSKDENIIHALERSGSGYLLVDHTLEATDVDSPPVITPTDIPTTASTTQGQAHADTVTHAEEGHVELSSEVASSYGGSDISSKHLVNDNTSSIAVPPIDIRPLITESTHESEDTTAIKPRTRSRSRSRSSTKGSPRRISIGGLKSTHSQASARNRRYSRTSQNDDEEEEYKGDDSTRYTAEIEKSASLLLENAKSGGREAWAQTKVAGTGALRGVIEAERAMEMILFGSYYKYSSTAFVTFKTRTAETITNQLMLDHDSMQIHHAPHPNDIIWENIAIPRNQIAYRNTLTNIALAVGSIFWSSLVTAINGFARTFSLPENQQNLVSVIILLGCLLMLPFIFDILARNYECMKLESEIQNAIMTRYFWYQVVNYYVTVALEGIEVHQLLLNSLRTPQVFITLLGKTIPAVSLYFVNVVIVKTFIAVPVEMLRPWQLTTILTMTVFTNKKKCTRRELRSGAFYAWPMLYGWVYPQLVVVLMIMLIYSTIAPLVVPFCVIFFSFTYIMYKYQLLYVYVNDYQSGGFMWYTTFNRSILSLLFMSIALLSFLTLDVLSGVWRGPFICLIPLPIAIIYFWKYTDSKFKKKMDLSFRLAKQRDHRNKQLHEAGRPIPMNLFKKHFYRQPVLTDGALYPEPYRKIDSLDSTSVDGSVDMEKGRRASTRNQPSTVSSNATTTAAAGQGAVFSPLHSHSQSQPQAIPQSDPDENPADTDTNTGTNAHPHQSQFETRMRASSMDMHRVEDEVEDPPIVLEQYFREYVLPLTDPEYQAPSSTSNAQTSTKRKNSFF